ncbi:MAG: AbrB/MazE/SpoVT family DNA-binding domain-containing protein [Patescibacteria group bacterium]|nr:AbrB/MazE/SpoVT family DNA-binding domain-containing protein [Patescibacteria group bacterium]
MSRRKLTQENIRKIMKSGHSYVVSLPLELIKEFGWKEKQKVTVSRHGRQLIIKDWKKKVKK